MPSIVAKHLVESAGSTVGAEFGLCVLARQRPAVEWAGTSGLGWRNLDGFRAAGRAEAITLEPVQGGCLMATKGASTKELMHRMGHSSMRAALIYQHVAAERDRAIADALNMVAERSRGVRAAAGTSPLGPRRIAHELAASIPDGSMSPGKRAAPQR